MRKIYIYRYLSHVTSNYHNGGGVIIITNKDPIELFIQYRRDNAEPIKYFGSTEEESLREDMEKGPDHPPKIIDSPEDIIEIFPDAGCC